MNFHAVDNYSYSNLNFINSTILPDTCTELPAAVADMTTTTTFPVIVGTVVEVRCQPGYTQTGGNTITCIQGVSYTIGERPTCTIGQCSISTNQLSRFFIKLLRYLDD